MLFTENLGQIQDIQGNAANKILFSTHSGGAKVFIKANGIDYQFEQITYTEGGDQNKHTANNSAWHEKVRKPVKTETHRFSLVLDGANLHPTIRKEEQSTYAENFYLPPCPQGITGVHTYGRLVFEDVYPGIDWVIYSDSQHMKYDFIVHPGADAGRIRLRVQDADRMHIDKSGRMIIQTRLGEVREEAPVSFCEGVRVTSSFAQQADGSVGFTLGAWPKSKTLVIDPSVVWATYYGGSGSDGIFSCVTDKSSNIYVSGTTNSTSGIASGGYQMTLGGNGPGDAFLAKIDSNNNRVWATYYGGSNDDGGYECTLSKSGNVYVTGYTTSTGLASGGFQNTLQGSQDGFLAKFNSNGIRLWATYYGGNMNTAGYSCTTDSGGYVFLAGSTTATTGIASNGFQNTFAGGFSDAFLVKFDSSGNRVWGTYYGGSNRDEAVCRTDRFGNVYLGGNTSSTANIAYNGFQNAYGGGGNDAFLAKFNSIGNLIWATYYGGLSDDGGERSISTDPLGNIYSAGITGSVSGIASGGFQNTFGGVSDGYLVKFDSSGSRLWATYYGGAQSDLPGLCTTDSIGNVYFAGATASANGIASGGYQNFYSQHLYNAFLVKFNSGGSRLWGTYYGDSCGHISCATGPGGYIYLCGDISSHGMIATGFQTSNGGTVDGFLAKFHPNNLQIDSPSNLPLCTGVVTDIPFTSTGTFGAGNIYTIQLSDISGSFSTPMTIGTLSSTANSGTIPVVVPATVYTGSHYRIRILSSSPLLYGGDNGADLLLTFPITPSISIVASPGTTVAAGIAVTFTSTITDGGANPQYQWFKNGQPIPGETQSIYTSTTLQDTDVISVRLTSSAICAVPMSVFSPALHMHISTSVASGFAGGAGSIAIFPNPNDGHFNLDLSPASNYTSKQLSVDLINAMGQVVFSTHPIFNGLNYTIPITIGGGISTGVYQLRINTGDAVVMKEVLIIK